MTSPGMRAFADATQRSSLTVVGMTPPPAGISAVYVVAPSTWKVARTGGIVAVVESGTVTNTLSNADLSATSGTGIDLDCTACVRYTVVGPVSSRQRDNCPVTPSVHAWKSGSAEAHRAVPAVSILSSRSRTIRLTGRGPARRGLCDTESS